MNYLIIANGDIINASDITYYQHLNYILIALDGVTNQLFKLNIYPKYVIGDLDSITQTTLDRCYREGVIVINVPDVNTTDLDKGIKLCIELQAEEVVIINALNGLRMDHLIYNYRTLKTYTASFIRLRLFKDDSYLEAFNDTIINASGQADLKLSIMSYPICQITSSGLKYDMNKHKLEFGFSESCSNCLENEYAVISIIGNALVIYDSQISIS